MDDISVPLRKVNASPGTERVFIRSLSSTRPFLVFHRPPDFTLPSSPVTSHTPFAAPCCLEEGTSVCTFHPPSSSSPVPSWSPIHLAPRPRAASVVFAGVKTLQALQTLPQAHPPLRPPTLPPRQRSSPQVSALLRVLRELDTWPSSAAQADIGLFQPDLRESQRRPRKFRPQIRTMRAKIRIDSDSQGFCFGVHGANGSAGPSADC